MESSKIYPATPTSKAEDEKADVKEITVEQDSKDEFKITSGRNSEEEKESKHSDTHSEELQKLDDEIASDHNQDEEEETINTGGLKDQEESQVHHTHQVKQQEKEKDKYYQLLKEDQEQYYTPNEVKKEEEKKNGPDYQSDIKEENKVEQETGVLERIRKQIGRKTRISMEELEQCEKLGELDEILPPFISQREVEDKVYLGDTIDLTYTVPESLFNKIYDESCRSNKSSDNIKDITLRFTVDMFHFKDYSYKNDSDEGDSSETTSMEEKKKDASAFLNTKDTPIRYLQRLSSQHIIRGQTNYFDRDRDGENVYPPNMPFELGDGELFSNLQQPVFLESVESNPDGHIRTKDIVYLCTEKDSTKFYIYSTYEEECTDTYVSISQKFYTCRDRSSASKFSVLINDHKRKQERCKVYAGNSVAILQNGCHLKNNYNQLILRYINGHIGNENLFYNFDERLNIIVDGIIADNGLVNRQLNPKLLFELKPIDKVSEISPVDIFTLCQFPGTGTYYLMSGGNTLCIGVRFNKLYLLKTTATKEIVFLEKYIDLKDKESSIISATTPFIFRKYTGEYFFWKLNAKEDIYEIVVQKDKPPYECCVFLDNTTLSVNPYLLHSMGNFECEPPHKRDGLTQQRLFGSPAHSKLLVPSAISDVLQSRVDTKVNNDHNQQYHHIIHMIYLSSKDSPPYSLVEVVERLIPYLDTGNISAYIKNVEEALYYLNLNKEIDGHIEYGFLMMLLKASQVIRQGVIYSQYSSISPMSLVFSHYIYNSENNRGCCRWENGLNLGFPEWLGLMICFPLTFHPFEDISENVRRAIVENINKKSKKLGFHDLLDIHKNSYKLDSSKFDDLCDALGLNHFYREEKKKIIKLFKEWFVIMLIGAYKTTSKDEVASNFSKDDILYLSDGSALEADTSTVLFKIIAISHPMDAIAKMKEVFSNISSTQVNDAGQGMLLGAMQHLKVIYDASNQSYLTPNSATLIETASDTIGLFSQALNTTVNRDFKVSPGSTSTYKGYDYSLQLKKVNEYIHEEVYNSVTQDSFSRTFDESASSLYFREMVDNEIAMTVLHYIRPLNLCSNCTTTHAGPVTHTKCEPGIVSLWDADRDTNHRFLESLVNCFLSRYDLYHRTQLSQTLLKTILELEVYYSSNHGVIKESQYVEFSPELMEIRDILAKEFPKAISYASYTQELEEGDDLEAIHKACCRLTEIIDTLKDKAGDLTARDTCKPIFCLKLHQQLILLMVRIRGILNYKHIQEDRLKYINPLCAQIYKCLTKLIHEDPTAAETIWRYKSSLFLLDHWEKGLNLNQLAANFAWKCISTVSVWNYTHSDWKVIGLVLTKWGAQVTDRNRIEGYKASKTTQNEIMKCLTTHSITQEKFKVFNSQKFEAIDDTKKVQEKSILLRIMHRFLISQEARMKPAYFVKWVLDFIAGTTTEYEDIEVIIRAASQLLSILKDGSLNKDEEIIQVLTSEETLNYLIYWCLVREYESTHNTRTLQCIVMEIISLIFKIDYKTSIGHMEDMFECKDFSQRFLIFCEEIIQTHVQHLELREEEAVTAFCDASVANGDILSHLLRLLKIFCYDSTSIRGHLNKQDRIYKNYNILEQVMCIVKQSKYSLKLANVSSTYVSILRLVVAIIDNKHTENEDSIITERIIHEAKFILEIGSYGADGNFYDINFKRLEEGTYNAPSSNWEIGLLKYNYLLILNSLMHREGTDFENMIDKYVLVRNMVAIYQQVRIQRNLNYTQDLFTDLSKIPVGSAKNDILFIEIGFLSYFIYAQVFRNQSFQEQNVVQITDKSGFLTECKDALQDTWFSIKRTFSKNSVLHTHEGLDGDRESEAIAFFDKYSSHVEIYIDKVKNTVYFPIMPAYVSLTQEEKNQIWYKIKLDDAKTLCTSIMYILPQKIEELEREEKLRNSWVVGNFNKRAKILKTMAVFLIILINIFILLAFDDRSDDEINELGLFGLNNIRSQAVIKVIGGLILLFFVLTIISIVKLFYWRAKLSKLDPSQSRNSLKSSGKSMKGFDLLSNSILLCRRRSTSFAKHRHLWFYLLLLVICILGLAYSDLFFAFTLLYVIYRTDKIMEVISAVWIPRERILSTLILICIIMYFFAIGGFVFLFKDFELNLEHSCRGIFSCFVTIYDVWYKADGAVGGFLSGAYSSLTLGEDVFNPGPFRIIYDSLFNFFVAILLIEILSGIIIDTFSSIREDREDLIEKQRARCYVCNQINQEISNFDSHTKFIHNIWDYMCYIGYIKNKKVLETHTERVMKDLIAKGDLSYFPCFALEDSLSDKTMVTMRDDIIKTISANVNATLREAIHAGSDMNQNHNSEGIKKLTDEMSEMKTKMLDMETEIHDIKSNMSDMKTNIDKLLKILS